MDRYLKLESISSRFNNINVSCPGFRKVNLTEPAVRIRAWLPRRLGRYRRTGALPSSYISYPEGAEGRRASEGFLGQFLGSLHCAAGVTGWDTLGEAAVCSLELWGRLAGFLINELLLHRGEGAGSRGARGSGQPLAGSAAMNALSALTNKAAAKSGPVAPPAKFIPATNCMRKLFFSCLPQCLDPDNRYIG